jgi:hypothetical protein
MRTYLVIANETLGGDYLLSQLRQRLAAGPARFHLLVPATPALKLDADTYADSVTTSATRELGTPHPSPDDLAWAMARRRLAHELARLEQAGITAHGEVGDADLIHGIGEALERERFDEVVICAPAQPIGRWLGTDLKHRVERTFGLPVTHCTEPPKP